MTAPDRERNRPPPRFGLWLVALGALLLPGSGAAQDDAGVGLRVYLVTVDPGEAITSRYGHTAIRVRDSTAGVDRAYGFAQSDLQRRGAFSALIQGQVDAAASETDTEELLERYASQGRAVWIQELSLEPGDRAALLDLLEHPGPRGANSFRYHFFRANCTTMVRDVLDEVLQGQLRGQTDGLPSDATYRAHAARLSQSHAALYSLSNLLMTDSVDRPITVWDEMFLPNTLRDRVRTATIVDSEGRTVPLVRGEEVRGDSSREPARATAVSTWLSWLLMGTVLGIAMAFLGSKAVESGRARVAFAVLGGGWALGIGLLGVVLAALWALGDQVLVSGNENLFAVSPFSLLVAVSAWGSERGMRRARLLAAMVAGVAALGLALKVLPAFDQDSWSVLALALPAHLGLAWGLWRASDP